ncbi:MAG: hypothetical protein RLZZ487_1458, partial [Pseudomonadota bacterium]
MALDAGAAVIGDGQSGESEARAERRGNRVDSRV